jgi:hypothetical protein
MTTLLRIVSVAIIAVAWKTLVPDDMFSSGESPKEEKVPLLFI